jgi:hypothetical protein
MVEEFSKDIGGGAAAESTMATTLGELKADVAAE